MVLSQNLQQGAASATGSTQVQWLVVVVVHQVAPRLVAMPAFARNHCVLATWWGRQGGHVEALSDPRMERS